MGAYILRRLLLVIPTLLGIMIMNFALTQFVPGGPIEQIIAEMEAAVTSLREFPAVGVKSSKAHRMITSAHVACPRTSSRNWSASSALTNRRLNGS